ncbi:MAG TPA: hypothetical protein ENJ95_01520 [Bacteroidetes bacterium]|nr:hypothetical protein [Bacteroidota bacterium]
MRTIRIEIPNDFDLQPLLWLFRRIGLKAVTEGDSKDITATVSPEIKPKEPVEQQTAAAQNLDFIRFANELYKGTEPLPIEAQEALEEAFLGSLKKEPTLPNRL